MFYTYSERAILFFTRYQIKKSTLTYRLFFCNSKLFQFTRRLTKTQQSYPHFHFVHYQIGYGRNLYVLRGHRDSYSSAGDTCGGNDGEKRDSTDRRRYIQNGAGGSGGENNSVTEMNMRSVTAAGISMTGWVKAIAEKSWTMELKTTRAKRIFIMCPQKIS